MNKIEKQNIVPDLGAELAGLKQEILKQTPKAVKPQELVAPTNAKEIKNSANELASLKNTILHSQEVQKQKESGTKLDKLLVHGESAENNVEKTHQNPIKMKYEDRKNTANAESHLPSDASAASNI